MTITLRATIILWIVVIALPAAAQVAGDSPAGPPDDATPMPIPAQAASVESVTLLLSGYHGLPDRQTFESLDGNVRAVLWTIATDETAFGYHRNRALAALGYWPDDALLDLYVELLQTSLEGGETPMAHHLVAMLAYTFGQEAVTFLTPLLQHDSVQVRLSAVHGLGVVGTASAVAALVEAEQSEQSPVVLDAISHTRLIAR